MSETERKTEENESSSDEEPPPGELDKPIVILYNKRAKKEIKRFEASETKDPKSKPEKKETIVNIPNGKGQSLETMSEVVKNFASESDKDLKVIFEILFGYKRVKLNHVRKHLRKWNGWDVDPDSQEHHELQEGIGSMTTENIKWAMDTLDISRRGLTKKEALVDKFCDWCMKPEPFGKDSSKSSSKKTSTKKSPTKVASKESKDDKPKKERKRKPEKDPNKPKKPQTAFLLFLNKNRVSFNEEAGTKNPGEIGKLASEKWKALSDADKEPFVKEAETAKAAYDIEIKEYNKNKPQDSPPKKPKKEESEKKIANKKTEKSSSPKAKVEKKPSAEKSKTEKNEKTKTEKNEKSKTEKSDSKSGSKKVTDSDKPMLALEKGKLVSKGSKKSSKPSENGTSSKKVDKKTEKKVEKSKSEKSKSKEKNSGSPKKPKNTIIIPNEKQIEKFLVQLIKQSNLEQLTMKQVLAKVAEKYPDMNVSSKKSFIKTKVKELIQ